MAGRYAPLSYLIMVSSAAAVGIYAGGGLSSWGDLIYHGEFLGIPIEKHEDLGTSFWVGGGVAVPIWEYGAGPVRPALELTTDVGFGMHSETGETGDLQGQEIAWKLIAPREMFVFALGLGPGGSIRPYLGFSGGVAVIPWSVTDPTSGYEWDSNTEVKAALGFPFGCEFFLTPTVGVGMRAEYLAVTGDANPQVENEYVRTALPDTFLFGAAFRADL